MSAPATNELFERADLFPRTTGHPTTLWSAPAAARADGNRMTIENTAVIGVRPSPFGFAGQLSADDEQAVFDRIKLRI